MRKLSNNNQRLRIAINAQILPGTGAGGVESVLIGLIKAIGKLEDDLEEYFIIGPHENPDWLKPYLGPNQQIIPGPVRQLAGRPLSQVPKPFRPLARAVINSIDRILQIERKLPEVQISNGFYEALECDCIHFPYQEYVICALPSVFNPHDLQHLYYPQFFTPQTIIKRDRLYKTGCHYANTIVVASQWIQKDITTRYNIDKSRIQIIPWAPPTIAYPVPTPDTIREVQEKYRLERPFALYPSMTWPHKNHIRLLEALALLRDQESLNINLVCTGHQNEFWPKIEKRMIELGLQNQVRFLGIVPSEQLRAVYRLSEFIIIPTLFEAASGPIFEAWQDDVPVACSMVTSLPEQAGDSALLFDPLHIDEIANALAKIATDIRLRDELRAKGRARLLDFSWERTAKAYRAVYRQAAGRSINDEDRWLLKWDWMKNPEREIKATAS